MTDERSVPDERVQRAAREDDERQEPRVEAETLKDLDSDDGEDVRGGVAGNCRVS